MERSEVQERYKWNVADIFASDEEWERAFGALEGEIDFKTFQGTLNTAENILAFMRAEDALSVSAMRVYLYAFLKHDEDVRVTKYQNYLAKVFSFFTKFETATAFAMPEITALPDDKLLSLASDPKLADYDYLLSTVIKRKKHILSEKEERLLAEAGEALSASGDVFEMLDSAEMDFPEIEHDGKREKLSHGLYSVIMNGKDRALRKTAFERYYSAYEKLIHTLATTYYGNVKKDIFYQKARGYRSCLEMSLYGEDVSSDVYRNLVEAANGSLPLLHRYMADRKKALGFDELHMYDLAVPLVEDADLRLSYEEAYEVVLKGLAPLGREYAELLKRGRDERWIDVCETAGKRSGAYSISAYGVHPYVLLNYQKTTHDVFTIAHEMGHSIHSYFSQSAQPYAKSDYKIFVAEVASTVNEVLLYRYLKQTATDPKQKKYLLNYFMDMVRTTFYRQTQFAEFEECAHVKAESGEPLNKDNLSDEYFKINKKYYGDAVALDSQIAIEWARIPHFYRSFYVYQYATGIASAVAIADRIIREGDRAVADYFAFLSGGCKTDPVSLLKIAGVDLTKKEAFHAIISEFEETLAEFERLL